MNVALPFFGKKPAPPRPAAAPDGRAPATEERPPPTELSGLDFSASDHGRSLARAAGLVEVQECGSGIGAPFEEAAVLYANGNDQEAQALLEAALTGEGDVGEGAWLMLLDLYRLGGHRQRFESRVLDYATRFERSPPPWQDLSPAVVRAKTALAPRINLSGQLSAAAAKQFEQVAAIARQRGGVRLDVDKVRGVDDPGCAAWRRLLGQLAAEHIGVTLLNIQSLADLLAKRVEAGRAAGRDTWLMLLELLQYAGDQARFEKLAADYAVSFEASPPAWERCGAGGASAQRPAPVVAAAEEGPDGFAFEGEMTGASNETLKRLAGFASGRNQLRIDCSRLRRIDFVCAGTLFNILVTLRAQGKLVSLVNVNAMVAGLLRVMSVDQVAHVTLRP